MIKNSEKVIRHKLNVLSRKIAANPDSPVLVKQREKLLVKTLEYRNVYYKLDDVFNTEITCYINNKRRHCNICNWLKT